MPTVIERIESVKAGIVGAIAFIIAELTVEVTRSLITSVLTPNSTGLIIDYSWLVQLTIGAISGFLFGITYRYVIRGDRNSHLNEGAVLAFGLVRGLALVENLTEPKLSTGLFPIISSVICFAIARLVLDLAIARKLVKPFI